MRGKLVGTIVIVCLFLCTPLVAVQGMQSMTIEQPLCGRENAYSSVTRDVQFNLSKTFEASNTITHPDFASRSAQDVVDGIDDFLPEGLSRVEEVEVYYADVNITITQMYIYEDRDIGTPGEVYLNLRLNDYDFQDYTYDNGGSYYVGNDGEYVDVDVQLITYLHSIDGWFLIEGHGWESDIDFDDYMGGDYLWYDLKDRTSYSVSGWWAFDRYPPDGGNNALQLAIEVEISFTNIHIKTFPDDFASPQGDGSYLISAIYLPKIHYDTFDSAGDVPVSVIYHQVYCGHDDAIGEDVYVILYLFYWAYETDNFGLNFGHYYDYEPVILYVEELGQEPYRIVYRDVGTNTLPPKMMIQDHYAPPSSGLTEVEVSTQLMPLLGDECNVTYQVTDTYFEIPAYHYYTDHGLSPNMTVPHLTITNTYHQMEVGIPIGSVDSGLTFMNLAPLSNTVIEHGYSLLDEAFESDVNVYEGVCLWNGGDYRVPENMSLTLDMLHNPLEFPYIVDCWEDVAHYTEAKQEYVANGLYYDISMGLTFTVPATVTLSVPTEVTRGESYEIDVDLELTSNDIIITFDYDINLGLVFDWWFIGIDKNVSYDGVIEFAVDLDLIADLISALGFSGEDVTGDYKEGWFTVTDFNTSPDLLSTMLDCTIEIHLLRILSDLLGATQVGKLIDILKIFLDDIDLIAHPTVSGFITGDIETDNSAISLSKSSMTFAESTTHHNIEMEVLSGSTETSSGIMLTNMQYNLDFTTDWGVEFDFTDTLNYFVDDKEVDVGTFPDITESSDEHELAADTSTGYDHKVSMTVSDPPVSTSTTGTSTTDTTGGTSTDTTGTGGLPTDGVLPTDMMLTITIGVLAAAVVVVIGVVFIKKRA